MEDVNLFGWLSKKNEAKLEQEKERLLKEKLASKVAKLKEADVEAENTVTDFTTFEMNGKKLRVAKEQINITDD